MKKIVTILFLVLLLAGLTVGYGGTISREYHKTHDFDGEEVSVETVNGKIFVETWNRDAVDVYAEIEVRANSKSAAREYMDQVEIVVRQRGDRLDIFVEQPHDKAGNVWGWVMGAGKPNATVNFTIKVPDHVGLEGASVNGAVEVVGIGGPVSLSTTNGNIVADEIDGNVVAGTTNGSIHVNISTDTLEDDVKLTTVNGSIKLLLDKDVEADVDIQTVNGSISTDFPLEVRGKWGPKNVNGQINGGGMRIEMETVNGSVAIIER